MKKNFKEVDELLKQINSEQEKYQTAINDDKPFDEVKKIYLQIKEYQKRLQVLINKPDQELVELGVLACTYVLL